MSDVDENGQRDEGETPFERAVARGGEALSAMAQGPAQDAAERLQATYADVGKAIEDALVGAATTGKVSFNSLAAEISTALASLAIEELFGRSPVRGLTSALSAPFFGSRADGGAVTPGGAYLVGERGPELFVPGQSGEVLSGGGGSGSPVTVNITIQGDAGGAGWRQSRSQVETSVARAVARGRKNM